MIKIKNLAWASALSMAIIAVIYDNNINGARGQSRWRSVSQFGGEGPVRYGTGDESAYYRGATGSSGPILAHGREASDASLPIGGYKYGATSAGGSASLN